MATTSSPSSRDWIPVTRNRRQRVGPPAAPKITLTAPSMTSSLDSYCDSCDGGSSWAEGSNWADFIQDDLECTYWPVFDQGHQSWWSHRWGYQEDPYHEHEHGPDAKVVRAVRRAYGKTLDTRRRRERMDRDGRYGDWYGNGPAEEVVPKSTLRNESQKRWGRNKDKPKTGTRWRRCACWWCDRRFSAHQQEAETDWMIRRFMENRDWMGAIRGGQGKRLLQKRRRARNKETFNRISPPKWVDWECVLEHWSSIKREQDDLNPYNPTMSELGYNIASDSEDAGEYDVNRGYAGTGAGYGPDPGSCEYLSCICIALSNTLFLAYWLEGLDQNACVDVELDTDLDWEYISDADEEAWDTCEH